MSLSIRCVPWNNLSWPLHPVSHNFFWSPKFELRRHLLQEGLLGHPSNEATLSCCPAYFILSSYHYLNYFIDLLSLLYLFFFFNLLQKACSMKAGALSVLLSTAPSAPNIVSGTNRCSGNMCRTDRWS